MNKNSIKKINVFGFCFIKIIIICSILFTLAYFYCKNDKIFAYIYWNNNNDENIILDENMSEYKNIHTVKSIVLT